METLAEFNVETTELSDEELMQCIRMLNSLYCESSGKERRMIDELLEEYTEEAQWRRF